MDKGLATTGTSKEQLFEVSSSHNSLHVVDIDGPLYKRLVTFFIEAAVEGRKAFSPRLRAGPNGYNPSEFPTNDTGVNSCKYHKCCSLLCKQYRYKAECPRQGPNHGRTGLGQAGPNQRLESQLSIRRPRMPCFLCKSEKNGDFLGRDDTLKQIDETLVTKTNIRTTNSSKMLKASLFVA